MWAEYTGAYLKIYYAHKVSKTDVFRSRTLHYTLGSEATGLYTLNWTRRLIDRAYDRVQRAKRVKVLVNPFSGQSRAQRYFARDILPLFEAAHCYVEHEETTHRNHAAQVAESINLSRFDVIACCSGDGLPHEVFNGLGRRTDARAALRQIAVAQLPCGTGNALSLNLNGTSSPSLAALCIIKGAKMPMDLVSVTQGSKRTLSFLSQAVGVIAEVDLGTEHLRWMGDIRMTYGFLKTILQKSLYPCDIAMRVGIQDKHAIREHYRTSIQQNESGQELTTTPETSPEQDLNLAGGLPELRYSTATDALPEGWTMVSYETLGSFFCGQMPFMSADSPFFSAALPSDGYMDLLLFPGDLKALHSVRMMIDLKKNLLFDDPSVRYHKISGFRIIPRRQGHIAVDGEHFPFEPFQAEVHQGLGTVISKSGRRFEGPGLRDAE